MASGAVNDAPDIWADDLLDRREDAEFLIRFLEGSVARKKLQSRQASFVLNVDGHWGAGKSFFVSRLANELRAGGKVVAEVNAWRDDHSDDPFIAVLAAIDAAVQPHVTKPGKPKQLWQKVTGGALPVFKRAGSSFVKTLVKKQIGESIEDVLDSLPETGNRALDKAIDDSAEVLSVEVERIVDETTEAMIKRFGDQTKAVSSFRDRLGAAATSLNEITGAPIFVIVDELDRCRPSYAIALLERVKHLFEVDNVVFVFSTNTDQLQHSVRGAYGPDFNGGKYLKRFFERTYLLPAPQPKRLLVKTLAVIDKRKVKAPIPDSTKFLESLVLFFRLDLREIEQFTDLLSATVAAWQHSQPVDLTLLAPLTLAFMRHNASSWAEVETQIPAEFSVVIGYRTVRYDQPKTPVELKIRSVISIFSTYGKSLDTAMNMPHDRGPESDYIRNLIMPEWNGQNISFDQPSAHYELPRLVQSAGRLSSYNTQLPA